MRPRVVTLAALVAVASACVGATGTTGGDVVDFPAAAAGPADAPTNGTFAFDTDRGWHVVLTKATMHVGAVYLSQTQPVSGAQVTSCVLPGTYVAQVTTGLDVDLLSASPQRFPAAGHGTTLDALVGQVWLAGGANDRDLDQLSDDTPVLVVAGTADRAGDVRPFSGTITIGANRQAQSTTGLAGSSPICKQRIVSPIPTHLVVRHGGGLLLRIDPRLLFVNVDFAQLAKAADGSGYAFGDDPTASDYTQPSINLYENLHAARAIDPLYSFTWEASL